MRLFDIVGNGGSNFKNSPRLLTYGKVTSVSYDETVPDKIGTIEYRRLTDREGLVRGTAYPLFPFIKQPPLVDEVIVLITGPSENTTDISHSLKVYYLTNVNIWNHPHHSATTETKPSVTLGTDFPELTDINPLLPFEGDTILEGRLGQSLRFSQSIPGKTPWIGEKSNPIIVISNGQVQTENGFEFIKEDINTDFSSIYLTSNQQIALEDKLISTNSYDTVPKSPNTYTDNQVIINSGRILLNAQKERVLLNGKEGIGLSSRYLNFDATENIVFESPVTYLTATSKNNQQRAVLGDNLTAELSEVYGQLLNVLNHLSILASTVGYVPLISATGAMIQVLETNSKKLKNRLLSDRIYLSK